MEPEEALGEHRQENETAGEDRLDDRQGRKRQRAKVQTPGYDRHAQPTKNHLELNRPTALRTGWRTTIGGASTAPRCLNRKARLVAAAEASARASPRSRQRRRRGFPAPLLRRRRGASLSVRVALTEERRFPFSGLLFVSAHPASPAAHARPHRAPRGVARTCARSRVRPGPFLRWRRRALWRSRLGSSSS